jgi:hypothetical protein
VDGIKIALPDCFTILLAGLESWGKPVAIEIGRLKQYQTETP